MLEKTNFLLLSYFLNHSLDDLFGVMMISHHGSLINFILCSWKWQLLFVFKPPLPTTVPGTAWENAENFEFETYYLKDLCLIKKKKTV